MHVIHLFVNLSADIGNGYSFRGYHDLNGRVVLSLSSMIDIVYFDSSCSVILYDSSFFWAQTPNTLIQKMTTPIIAKGVRANKNATN